MPIDGNWSRTFNPGSGELICNVADSSEADVAAAVAAANKAFPAWQDTQPAERAKLLRAAAEIVRANGDELIALDALNCGNPVTELASDAAVAAATLDFFAGLVTEIKGSSIPLGPESVNFSVRQPLGAVARILAFNHPFMFCAAKIAAPLAAGNTLVIKPPEQAPLSALRFAELIDGVFPPGVVNIVLGGREAGAALASHPEIAMISVIGSIAAGRAVMQSASDTVKPVLLELGGKNALIAFPDAEPDAVAEAVIQGMNFGWCGQSCGATSRAFIHTDIYDAIVDAIKERIGRYKPGIPTDPATNMGAIVSKGHMERILNYIDLGKKEGARLLCGGQRPTDPSLSTGYYVNPTAFCDVTPDMRIAREEIFGPILCLLRWSDEHVMLEHVNELEYGLTCSIWTRDIDKAHRTAMAVHSGYVWINEVSKHFLGAPYGGTKMSGIGKEECLEELISFTQEKNIHIRFAALSKSHVSRSEPPEL